MIEAIIAMTTLLFFGVIAVIFYAFLKGKDIATLKNDNEALKLKIDIDKKVRVYREEILVGHDDRVDAGERILRDALQASKGDKT